jgi:outer membrane protein assembly factor BamD (BamD/ComL family)
MGAGLHEEPEYRAARQALQDGVAAVAAVKAERLLGLPKWDSEERSDLAALAVQGWLTAGEGRRVLQILDREEIPREAVARARALMLAGQAEAAEKVLAEEPGRAPQEDEEERLLLAQIRLGRGRQAQARETVAPLLRSSDPKIREQAQLMEAELALAAGEAEKALASLTGSASPPYEDLRLLLRARALVGLGRHEEAQDLLADIFSGTTGGEAVHHMAAVLRAESLLRQERAPEAVEAMVAFLDNTAQTELWPEAFTLLDRALAATPAVAPPPASVRWIAEGNSAQQAAKGQPGSLAPESATFQGHALVLAAQWLARQQRTQEALGLLEAFLAIHAEHPQSETAMRLALENYADLRIDARVTVLADQWRSRYGGSPMVAAVTGGAAFERGDHARAAQLFQDAANLDAEPRARRAALFNAGVAALKAGEMALYQSLLGQLEAAAPAPGGATALDLELGKALDEARTGKADALRTFVNRHPEHPRTAEARVALAEALLLKPGGDVEAAESALNEATAGGLSEELLRRAGYVRIWLQEKRGRLKEVTEAGAEFLKAWPDAPQAAEVRMKVADAYFRLGNFANAGTEFELVAREHPDSPFADTALYFAGLSSFSMIGAEGRENAISLWQELAEKGGPLAIPARQQQAMAKLLDDKPAEALKLLDDLLKEKALPDEMRWTLACEKAEILIRLGKTEPARLKEAIESLQALRGNKAVEYLWRARAGHTLAWALNEAGRPTEALEVCYEVVRGDGTAAAPSNPAEYRWYYRAGFFGIDLLKAAKQWEAAARMAELLAQSTGDRAAEAREQANTIRLEHFLWDGETK